MGTGARATGTFRTRRHDQGDLEIWASGWRLGIRFLSLAPAAMAVGFALSTIALPVRMLGCAGLLGSAFVLHRLTAIGIRLGPEGITFHDVLRSHRIPWADVVTFMGERTRHDGRLVLLRTDGTRLVAPGSLTGEEMNPIGDEGDLSAVEELNRMVDAYRTGVPIPAGEAPAPRPRRRARGPATRPRPIEAPPAPGPPPVVHVEEPLEALAAVQVPLRHPHVPRPPAPEPEPEPTGRTARRARRRARDAAPDVVEVEDPNDPRSPGARLLASFDDGAEV